MAHTPRIATSGAFKIGVKLSMPMAPRFVTVKVPPDKSSGSIAPSIQLLASRLASVESSRSERVFAFFMIGTINPRGVSTANPR